MDFVPVGEILNVLKLNYKITFTMFFAIHFSPLFLVL